MTPELLNAAVTSALFLGMVVAFTCGYLTQVLS